MKNLNNKIRLNTKNINKEEAIEIAKSKKITKYRLTCSEIGKGVLLIQAKRELLEDILGKDFFIQDNITIIDKGKNNQ